MPHQKPRPLSADQHDAQGTLTHLILDAGLEDDADAIARLTRPSLVLTTRKAVRADLTLGASRLGGEPDLPKDAAWPEHAGKPLPFLAQIRLEDVTAHDPNGLLPAAGLLSFFGRGHVRFAADVTTLERRELPDAIDEEDRLFAWGFDVRGAVSLPPVLPYRELAYALCDALDHGPGAHPMLGCLDDRPDDELLLAINSDENAHLELDEALRFYIDRAALAALDFSKVTLLGGG